jgi:large subunit ribosomal protein L5
MAAASKSKTPTKKPAQQQTVSKSSGKIAPAEVAEGKVASHATAVPRLKQKYREEVAPAIHKEFGYGNVMQIPGLTKVVVNMGVGEAARDSKVIDGAVRDLTQISGQKPIVTKARKSIAQFKLREGMPIGCHVTLRGDRMWEFADRLLTLALPRIRDFRGLSAQQFDGQGNYTFGLTEQVMFHEIDQDRIDRVRGMDITFVTTATTDDEGRALLKALGFPFKAPADDDVKAGRRNHGPVMKGKKPGKATVAKMKK